MKPSSLLLLLASRRSIECLGIRRHRDESHGLSKLLRTLFVSALLIASGLSPRLLPDHHATSLLIFCVAGPFVGWVITASDPFAPDNV